MLASTSVGVRAPPMYGTPRRCACSSTPGSVTGETMNVAPAATQAAQAAGSSTVPAPSTVPEAATPPSANSPMMVTASGTVIVSSIAGTAARTSPRTIVRHSPGLAARTTAITPAGTIVLVSTRPSPPAVRDRKPGQRGVAGLPVPGEQQPAPGQLGRARRGGPRPVAEADGGLPGADARHDRGEDGGAPGRHVRIGMEADPRPERLPGERLPGRVARAAAGELDLADPAARRFLHRVQHMPGAQQRPGHDRPRDLGRPVPGGQPEQ